MIYKAAAAAIPFTAYDPDTGAGVEGLNGFTARIQQDSLAAADLPTPAVTEIGHGVYRIALSAADLDADTLLLFLTHPSAIIPPITIITDDPYPAIPDDYAKDTELLKVVNKLPANSQNIAGVNDVQPVVNVTTEEVEVVTQEVDLSDVLDTLATLLTAFTPDPANSDGDTTTLQPVATADALANLATAFTPDPDTGTLTLTLTPSQLTAIAAAVLSAVPAGTEGRLTLGALALAALNADSATVGGQEVLTVRKPDGSTYAQIPLRTEPAADAKIISGIGEQ